MSIFDKNFFGKTKLENSIDLLQQFEPKEGYYLAFSGGKDSIVIKTVADMAKVKYDAHYMITTVDPPELTKFIKEHHRDVERHAPDINMWDLIVKKLLPPTRIVRYCCSELKESGGNGRFAITGVRWAESSKRKNNRKFVEYDTYGSKSKKSKLNREKFNLMNDNDEKRRMMETCVNKGKHVVNPIVDWTDADVWEFIKHFKIPYCHLYDEGFNRLGCIGCPMAGTEHMEFEFKKYPHIKKLYIKAFDRMVEKRKEKSMRCAWNNGQEVFDWWLYGNDSFKQLEGQEDWFNELEDDE